MKRVHGHALTGVRVQKVQKVQRGVVGAFYGHALTGVRVQKVQKVLRFDSGFAAEGCGGRLRRQFV